MTGWELDGPALEALGELANTGARCPECSCPLDEHSEDGGHAIDCIVVNCRDAIGRVVVAGSPPCRVRACPWPSVRAGHCVEHDTPAVRAMERPHTYVFEGRRVVLESQPWDAPPPAPDGTRQLDNPVHSQVPPSPPRPASRATGRPCWSWCGRPGPAPRCHPASRYGRAPTFPCLTCGREIHACEGDVLHCLQCAPFARDLEALGPARAVAAWFDAGQLEYWEERAAILQDSGFRRDRAELRAAVLVWRASPAAAPAAAAAEPATAAAPRQLAMF